MCDDRIADDKREAMRATGTDGKTDSRFAPVFAPGTAEALHSGAFPDILTADFGAKASKDSDSENRTKPTKKARSEGYSDRASGMETKGLEPSTSALRTQETRVLSEEQSGVTTTAAEVSATVSPRCPKSDVDSTGEPSVESDFTAAIQMIANLPLSKVEKTEAVRRLLAVDAE